LSLANYLIVRKNIVQIIINWFFMLLAEENWQLIYIFFLIKGIWMENNGKTLWKRLCRQQKVHKLSWRTKIIINGADNNTVSSSADKLPYYHKYSQSGVKTICTVFALGIYYTIAYCTVMHESRRNEWRFVMWEIISE